MAEQADRAADRFDNLQAIEPLLASMRVLSLSTMQMALNRQEALDKYALHFAEVLDQIKASAGPKKLLGKTEKDAFAREVKVKSGLLLVLGSARGIVGQYNRNLARLTAEHLQENPDETVEVLAYGKRVQSALTQAGVNFSPREPLNKGSQPDYPGASQLLREWLQDYELGKLKQVRVLSFRKSARSSDYQPQLTTIIPDSADLIVRESPVQLPWPPPIIEGDPKVLFEKIKSHLLAIRFYQLILDGIIAENLYRYRLLEEAKENTAKLLDELGQAIQMERRKVITQQLLGLLTGAGLLERR